MQIRLKNNVSKKKILIKSSTCYFLFRDPNILLLTLFFVHTLPCFHPTRKVFLTQEEWTWVNIFRLDSFIGFWCPTSDVGGHSTFVSLGMTNEDLSHAHIRFKHQWVHKTRPMGLLKSLGKKRHYLTNQFSTACQAQLAFDYIIIFISKNSM